MCSKRYLYVNLLRRSEMLIYGADHSLPTSASGGVGPEFAMLLWLISVDMSLFSEQEN
jgi:hypothetical protein